MNEPPKQERQQQVEVLPLGSSNYFSMRSNTISNSSENNNNNNFFSIDSNILLSPSPTPSPSPSITSSGDRIHAVPPHQSPLPCQSPRLVSADCPFDLSRNNTFPLKNSSSQRKHLANHNELSSVPSFPLSAGNGGRKRLNMGNISKFAESQIDSTSEWKSSPLAQYSQEKQEKLKKTFPDLSSVRSPIASIASPLEFREFDSAGVDDMPREGNENFKIKPTFINKNNKDSMANNLNFHYSPLNAANNETSPVEVDNIIVSLKHLREQLMIKDSKLAEINSVIKSKDQDIVKQKEQLSQYTSFIQQYSVQSTKLQEKFKKFLDQMSQIQSSSNSNSKILNQVQDAINQYNSVKSQIQEKIKQIENENFTVKKECEKSSNENKKLTEKIINLEAEVTRLDCELTEAKCISQSLQESRNNLETQLQSTTNHFNSTLDSIQKEFSFLQQEKQEFLSQCNQFLQSWGMEDKVQADQQNNILSILNEKFNEFQNAINIQNQNNHQQIQSLMQEIEHLKSVNEELTALQKRQGEKTSTVNDNQEEVNLLKQQIEQLKKEKQLIEEQSKEKLSAAIKSQQVQNENDKFVLEQRCRRLEQDLEAANQAKKSLQEKIELISLSSSMNPPSSSSKQLAVNVNVDVDDLIQSLEQDVSVMQNIKRKSQQTSSSQPKHHEMEIIKKASSISQQKAKEHQSMKRMSSGASTSKRSSLNGGKISGNISPKVTKPTNNGFLWKKTPTSSSSTFAHHNSSSKKEKEKEKEKIYIDCPASKPVTKRNGLEGSSDSDIWNVFDDMSSVKS